MKNKVVLDGREEQKVKDVKYQERVERDGKLGTSNDAIVGKIQSTVKRWKVLEESDGSSIQLEDDDEE